jgi:hypothetical protein
MRTTLTIDSEVLAEFKKQAAQTHRTLSALIEGALREHLARQRDVAATKPVEFPIVTGRGLAPGVDLARNVALLDFVDEADGVVGPVSPKAGEAPETGEAPKTGETSEDGTSVDDE